MSRFKYMGTADMRCFEKGEDFGGRLSEPLGRRVSFDWSNRHTVDSDDEANADLPKQFWALLAVEPGFQDVTDVDIIPVNEAEKLWKGMRNPNDPQNRGVLTGQQSVQRSVSSLNKDYPTDIVDSPLPDPPAVEQQ